jgi:hypothetical protein
VDTGTAVVNKKATADKGGGHETFFAGNGTAIGARSAALTVQQALGAPRVWHANRIARQHADPSSFVVASLVAQSRLDASEEKRSKAARNRVMWRIKNHPRV